MWQMRLRRIRKQGQRNLTLPSASGGDIYVHAMPVRRRTEEESGEIYVDVTRSIRAAKLRRSVQLSYMRVEYRRNIALLLWATKLPNKAVF